MTADNRPNWPHHEMSEADFRRIRECGMVVAVEAKWKFTGDDSSRQWLEAKCGDGKTRVLPESWQSALRFVGYASSPGLFELTFQGQRMLDTVKQIDAWETRNQRERAEFERLKQKFSQTGATK